MQHTADRIPLDLRAIDALSGAVQELFTTFEERGGETTDELDAALDEMLGEQGSVPDALDAAAGALAAMNADADAAKRLAKSYAERAKHVEERAGRVREAMKRLTAAAGGKVRGALGGYNVQKAGGMQRLLLDPGIGVEDVEERFVTTKTVFNEDAVRAAMEAGEDVPFAALAERKEVLVIRR